MSDQRSIRQTERAAKARERELQRIRKEVAKLGALEQARLEVATFENHIELLTSLHKEPSQEINWQTFGSLIPPCPPLRVPRRELAHLFYHAKNWSSTRTGDGAADAALGRTEDDELYAGLLGSYEEELANWKRIRALAKRVLAGEADAYTSALREFSNISELSHLGSSLQITVHSPRLVECDLKVNGRECIPDQVKSLTAGGKVSVKAMPKARFHEIYQDYVCSAALRLARLIAASLPVHTILITTRVDELNPINGALEELPVLSVSFTRSELAKLDFETLDPSDTIETFTHRGDVLASRKTGMFTAIVPIAASDLVAADSEEDAIATLIGRARELRLQIARDRKRFTQSSAEPSTDSPVE